MRVVSKVDMDQEIDDISDYIYNLRDITDDLVKILEFNATLKMLEWLRYRVANTRRSCPKTIGERIRFLMKYNHLNQYELAERLGVTQSTVSKYVTNDLVPSIYVLFKMSRILKTTSRWILYGEEFDDKIIEKL